MYLSRLLPNPLSQVGRQLIRNPYSVHQLLSSLFDDPKSERILFRTEFETDRAPWILFQSKRSAPDFQKLAIQFSDLRGMPETKVYNPEFSEGDRLTFRLLARPTKRISSKTESVTRGKRTALNCDEDRLRWLARKAPENGFLVEQCELTLGDFRDYKGDDRPKKTFSTSRFEGTLIVSDCEKLLGAVANGIGSQKMQGFGLLSVIPSRAD